MKKLLGLGNFVHHYRMPTFHHDLYKIKFHFGLVLEVHLKVPNVLVRFGVGMALAILGGNPNRFKHLVDLYRQAGIEAGHSPEALKVGVTGHAYIAKTTQQAKDEFYPYYSNYWYYVNRQRGFGRKMSREDFEHMAVQNTALFVGSPEQIVEKVLQQHELFGHTRFLAQVDIGGLPFDKVAKNIELLATEVVPQIRKAIR